ncbi:MAG TPA: hypothetical protein VJN62_03120, partial [Gemmatimonadales bacterium]|nr:hypothetical protein [Gemmatimonadales bacterium]
LVVLSAACTANQDVLTAPEPQTLGAYLASRHPADILVTDKSGGTRWIHNPAVQGDSLRGVRGHDLPRLPVSIAVAEVAGVQEAHFSTGRTLGLVGAILGVLAVAALVLGSSGGYSY